MTREIEYRIGNIRKVDWEKFVLADHEPNTASNRFVLSRKDNGNGDSISFYAGRFEKWEDLAREYSIDNESIVGCGSIYVDGKSLTFFSFPRRDRAIMDYAAKNIMELDEFAASIATSKIGVKDVHCPNSDYHEYWIANQPKASV